VKLYPILIERVPPALAKVDGISHYNVLLSFAGGRPYLVPDLMTATSLIISYPAWVGCPTAPVQVPQGLLEGNQQGTVKDSLTVPSSTPKGKERN
jgi:hypothetical protein